MSNNLTRHIFPLEVFDAVTVALSTTQKSSVIDLEKMELIGFFSLQFTITGSGVIDFKVEVSNDGTTFVEYGTNITTGSVAGSDLVSFVVPVCKEIKITATETGGAASATVSATIACQ